MKLSKDQKTKALASVLSLIQTRCLDDTNYEANFAQMCADEHLRPKEIDRIKRELLAKKILCTCSNERFVRMRNDIAKVSLPMCAQFFPDNIRYVYSHVAKPSLKLFTDEQLVQELRNRGLHVEASKVIKL